MRLFIMYLLRTQTFSNHSVLTDQPSSLWHCLFLHQNYLYLTITGPPTRSVGVQTSDDLWRLSSSVTLMQL